jgi:ABC-type Fe3+-hydroxamate transport system substrate-binding protein
MDPDRVILAPCGLTLEMTRREHDLLAEADWWRGLRAVKNGRVAIVDGVSSYLNQHLRVEEGATRATQIVAILFGSLHYDAHRRALYSVVPLFLRS